MRTTISLLGFLAWTLGLHAGHQTFTVAPGALAGWTLIGTDAPAAAGGSELALPANAQLARSFPATEIAVQIATQPVLGENAGDWPVLEIGSAALIFTRSGATGRLALVLGDGAPQELPVAFALDAAGRSLDAITVDFARAGAVVTVATAGRVWDFSAEPADGRPLEVVVSAGASQPWILQRLEVTAATAEPVARPAPGGSPARGSTDAPVGSSRETGGEKSSAPGVGAAGPLSAPVPAAGPKAAAPPAAGSGGSLEIFTPPSVRHGRADEVRAAVEGQTRN